MSDPKPNFFDALDTAKKRAPKPLKRTKAKVTLVEVEAPVLPSNKTAPSSPKVVVEAPALAVSATNTPSAVTTLEDLGDSSRKIHTRGAAIPIQLLATLLQEPDHAERQALAKAIERAGLFARTDVANRYWTMVGMAVVPTITGRLAEGRDVPHMSTFPLKGEAWKILSETHVCYAPEELIALARESVANIMFDEVSKKVDDAAEVGLRGSTPEDMLAALLDAAHKMQLWVEGTSTQPTIREQVLALEDWVLGLEPYVDDSLFDFPWEGVSERLGAKVRPGQFIGLWAASGQCKSWAALDFVVEACSSGVPTVFTTREMAVKLDIVPRLLSLISGVRFRRDGSYMAEDREAINTAWAMLKEWLTNGLLTLDDKASTVASVVELARRNKARFLVVDNVYKLKASGEGKNDQAYDRIKLATNQIKEFCVARDIAVLGVFQAAPGQSSNTAGSSQVTWDMDLGFMMTHLRGSQLVSFKVKKDRQGLNSEGFVLHYSAGFQDAKLAVGVDPFEPEPLRQARGKGADKLAQQIEEFEDRLAKAKESWGEVHPPHPQTAEEVEKCVKEFDAEL